MKRYILAGAAALALALPATAQNTATTTGQSAMTATQKSMYDSWPPDRRAAYDRWPSDYRSYYWTLTPSQQSGWWVLTDDQRARLYAMTPEQRTAAWSSIASQMSGATAANASSATTTNASAATRTGNINWVSNAVVQNISADAPPANPPICNKGQTDNCINAWEAGKRGPGVTKPLGYWPGKPASDVR